MSKSLLLSIKPKYVSMILNKTKTIEVRKRFPLNYRGWVYIYCTKEDTLSILTINCKDIFTIGKDFVLNDFGYLNSGYEGKGKVVARFYCDNVEEISYNYRGDFTSVYTDTLDTEDLEKQSCLTKYEFAKYLQGNYGYAIHISQLEIFDKPKELNEFRYIRKSKWTECVECEIYTKYQDSDCFENKCLHSLTKAPQSWQYIEVAE